MSNDKSNPQMRGFADALIGLEETINYVLEMAHQRGINLKIEPEVVNMAHSPSRLHLRMVTPDMEVQDDLRDKAGKAAFGTTTGEAAG